MLSEEDYAKNSLGDHGFDKQLLAVGRWEMFAMVMCFTICKPALLNIDSTCRFFRSRSGAGRYSRW